MKTLKVLALLLLSAILFCNIIIINKLKQNSYENICSTKESYDGSYDVVYKGDFARMHDPLIEDIFYLKRYVESDCYKLETIAINQDTLTPGVTPVIDDFGYISICLGKKRNAKKTLLRIRDNMKNHTEEFFVSNLKFSLYEIEKLYEIYEDYYKNALFSEEEYQKLKHDVVYAVKDTETNSELVFLALDMVEEMIEKID